MNPEEVEAWYDAAREELYNALLKSVSPAEDGKKQAKAEAVQKENGIAEYHRKFALLREKYAKLMAEALDKERAAQEKKLPGNKMKK